MKKLLSALFLLCGLSAFADTNYIQVRIAITNNPVITNGLIFTAPVATTRLYTNSSGATTINTNQTLTGATTNLFLHFAAYGVGVPRLSLSWVSSNSFDLIGNVDQALSLTTTGYWATLTFTTNTVTKLTTVRVPIGSETGDTNRTNIASLLVKGISDHSTNSFSQTATALANHVNIGQIQTSTNKTFRSVTNNGGFFTNINAQRLYTTYSATGSNGFGFSGGAGFVSTMLAADANGYPLLLQVSDWNAAEPTDKAHLLTLYWAQQIFPGLSYTNVWGGTNFFNKTWFSAPVDTTNSFNVSGTNIGVFNTNGTITSATFTGNTNIWAGARAEPVNLIAGLANGNNADIKVTNIVNLLMGPTGPFTNTGFVHAFGNREGLVIEIMNTNGFPMAFLNQSGLEGNSTYRIITGTGGTVVITNNPGSARFRYDNTFFPGRWILVGKTD